MSRPITKKNKSYLDSMVIGAGHSIMMGHVPEVMSNEEGLTKLSQNFFAWNKASQESIQSLGFFGSDIDYNTYYPNLDTKDLSPQDSEFIEPMFRLLSSTIVSKNYNPTDFSQDGVLKASMKYLLGQTVNCDHETNIGNAIGAVSKVVWQEAYKDGRFTIPAGINGILKIDGKANPRIARGILMDPPSIHSNSVTVQFKWDKSHPEMEDNEFYQKLGTYDAKGNMIRRMVTEVVKYYETSLVSHGADSFAQKIGKDGKIINPDYAQRSWNSYAEYQEDKSRIYFYNDMKTENFIEGDTKQFNNNNGSDKTELNNNNMDELKEFLEKLFGKDMLTLGEGQEMTQEVALELIKGLVDDKASMTEKITNLETEKTSLSEKVTNLEAEVLSMKDIAELGKSYVSKLRETVVNNYKKVQGDSFNETDPVFVMLNSEATPVLTLEALNKGYEQRLEELFPLKCSKCGSKDVSRASSVEEPEDIQQNQETETVKNTAEVTKEILANKNKYKFNS